MPIKAANDLQVAVASAESLDTLAARRSCDILEFLREPRWRERLRFWRPRAGDPELRKLLVRIHSAICNARRLEAVSVEGLGQGGRELAYQLLASDPKKLSLDTALEVIDGWDQILIQCGDERYLRDLLAAEFARDRTDTTATTWTDVFGKVPDENDAGILRVGGPLEGQRLDAARNQLAAIYRTRSILYNLHRARQAMKARHLWLLAPVLLVLIVSLAVSIELAGGSLTSILLAAVAGGLGAAISGTRNLRDHIRNINDLRGFAPSVIVQPLLGTAAGLLLLFVLESKLIAVNWGGPIWASQAALAFVAGFSEPFFLSIVARVGEIGEERSATVKTGKGKDNG